VDCMRRCRLRPAAACSHESPSPVSPQPPTITTTATTTEEALRVHIWQSPGLTFMYSPAVASLQRVLEAATSRPLSVDFRACWPCDFGAVEPGDLFIWVGCVHRHEVPFTPLARRGAQTVYYQTAPLGDFLPDIFESRGGIQQRNETERRKVIYKPAGIPVAVDEVWDYSSKNVALIRHTLKKKRSVAGGLSVTYMPISMDPSARPLRHADQPPPKLIFIGDKRSRPARWSVLSADQRIAPHLLDVMDVWNRSAYEALLNAPGASIFLNLHKGNSDVLEGLRVSDLISHGALVLSERSFHGDEEAYSGLVDFVPLHVNQQEGSAMNLAEAFLALRRLSGAERQAIADERRLDFERRFGACAFANRARKSLCRAWCKANPSAGTDAARAVARARPSSTARRRVPFPRFQRNVTDNKPGGWEKNQGGDFRNSIMTGKMGKRGFRRRPSSFPLANAPISI
jgi:hypothetical protein